MRLKPSNRPLGNALSGSSRRRSLYSARLKSDSDAPGGSRRFGAATADEDLLAHPLIHQLRGRSGG